METTRSFYVTLPSNGSMNVFPDNTVTEYKNKLPRPLHLDGEWEVGLVECTYPYSWFQICNETSEIYTRNTSRGDEGGKWLKATLNPVRVINATEIGLRRYLPDDLRNANVLLFDGHNFNWLVKMKAKTGKEVRFEGKITQTLGVPDPFVLEDTWTYGRYPWAVQNVHQIFVYTDIISPHAVGDREVPLLKQFCVTGLPDFGLPVNVTPPVTAYYPVNRNPIDSIEIVLRDGTGKKIPFTSGRTIVTLHFRQQRSARL